MYCVCFSKLLFEFMPELLFVLLGYDQSGCYGLFAELLWLVFGLFFVIIIVVVFIFVAYDRLFCLLLMLSF